MGTVTSQANKITSVSPTTVSSASTNALTLGGGGGAGDLEIWATDCSSATPNVDPTDGEDQATSMTITGVGTYKLCLREAGTTDSVEQTGITMTVTTQTDKITSVSPTTVSSASTNALTLGGVVGAGDLV